MLARRSGFTLIELLVVVSIISILTLIALPNTTLAMTRAKISRVKNDMRVVSSGLEIYAVDNNHYPKAIMLGDILKRYHTAPKDIFSNGEFRYEYHTVMQEWGLPRVDEALGTSYTLELGTQWMLASVGPDKDLYNGVPFRYEGSRDAPGGEKMLEPITAPYRDYDATNGTLSKGNIFRTSKSPEHLHGNPDLYKDVYYHFATAHDR